jgi:hypothetical protein
MKLREEHVNAVGGCAPCQFEPVAKASGPPAGASVKKLGDHEDSWVGIELAESAGKGKEKRPVAGEVYEVILPDGSPVSGTLDARGKVLLVGFEPGDRQCTIKFPNLDRRDVS